MSIHIPDRLRHHFPADIAQQRRGAIDQAICVVAQNRKQLVGMINAENNIERRQQLQHGLHRFDVHLDRLRDRRRAMEAAA